MAQNTEEQRDAAQHESADLANLQTATAAATTGTEPSSTVSPVAGRPWLVRDEHGVFRAASPAGADPVVAADVETFEKGIEASYPNASPALRLMAVRTFAMFRRHERASETSPPRPGGRVPAAVREAGAWLDRLTRIMESLEATNTRKRAKDPARAMADLQALIASRKA
jgi:hypothetical protein